MLAAVAGFYGELLAVEKVARVGEFAGRRWGLAAALW
jgi:hypothetical protein